MQHLRHALVRRGLLAEVAGVVRLERVEHLLLHVLGGAHGKRAVHELPNAVAHVRGGLLYGDLREAVGAERVVYGGVKVLDGVEEGSVQVEDGCLVRHDCLDSERSGRRGGAVGWLLRGRSGERAGSDRRGNVTRGICQIYGETSIRQNTYSIKKTSAYGGNRQETGT